MMPPTMKAKMTDPTGTAIPRAIRSMGAGSAGRRAGEAAATILPIGSGGGGYVGGGHVPAPRFPLLLGDVSGRCERSGLDLRREGGQLGRDVRGQAAGIVVDGVAGAVVGDAERQSSTGEGAGDDVLDCGVGGDVHLLERAGDDRRVGVLLVGVHADAVDLRLACRLQSSEAAATGNLEDDVGVTGDLVLGDTLALRRVGA